MYSNMSSCFSCSRRASQRQSQRSNQEESVDSEMGVYCTNTSGSIRNLPPDFVPVMFPPPYSCPGDGDEHKPPPYSIASPTPSPPATPCPMEDGQPDDMPPPYPRLSSEWTTSINTDVQTSAEPCSLLTEQVRLSSERQTSTELPATQNSDVPQVHDNLAFS